MPHIHAVPTPRRSSGSKILLAIILLLIVAALAWYFIAGPGKSMTNNVPELGMAGQLVITDVSESPGTLHMDMPRAIEKQEYTL